MFFFVFLHSGLNLSHPIISQSDMVIISIILAPWYGNMVFSPCECVQTVFLLYHASMSAYWETLALGILEINIYITEM